MQIPCYHTGYLVYLCRTLPTYPSPVRAACCQTANHFGTPLKVYGRDNNRHREGRRNFVEHVEHEDPVDNSKRSRIRFNVEGPHGHGMAYAEVYIYTPEYIIVYLLMSFFRLFSNISVCRSTFRQNASRRSTQEGRPDSGRGLGAIRALWSAWQALQTFFFFFFPAGVDKTISRDFCTRPCCIFIRTYIRFFVFFAQSTEADTCVPWYVCLPMASRLCQFP